MQNDFIMCALFTDDRSLSSDNVNTIGDVNTELQIKRFNINAQPYYVVVDPTTEQVLRTQSYNPDADSFLSWLKR